MARKPAQILAEYEKGLTKADRPDFNVGDTVKVHNRIKEGSKERVQIFQGVVIRKSHGNRATATFTVRKISFNVGVEKTFLVNAPTVEKIEVVSSGMVRRARLYYLRDLQGKAAKVKKSIGSDLINSGNQSDVIVAPPVVDNAAAATA